MKQADRWEENRWANETVLFANIRFLAGELILDGHCNKQ